jgi:hypothetical protein
MRIPGWTAEMAAAPSFPDDNQGSSCGLLWLLCTALRDQWACRLYATLPACNPCVPHCDPQCRPAPGQPPGVGYRDCVDSHCVAFQVLCPR